MRNTARGLGAVTRGAGIVAGSVGAAAAGWAAYSSLFVDHHRHLPNAMSVPRRQFVTAGLGAIAYYADPHAEGRPLVLVHSVNAAASAYEMKPLFEHYRGKRPVYAIDLPGFGFSERSDRAYLPELFAGAVTELVESEIGAAPVDCVALSLSCEFCARAQVRLPNLFGTLTMISPTGFSPTGRKTRALPQALRTWAFFDLIVSKPSLRYYLRKSFMGPVPRQLVEYDYATSHRPGAHYAPICFLTGQLFTPDVRARFYDRVTCPVLVLYDQDAYSDFSLLPDFVRRHSNWIAVRIPETRGMPHFEKPDQTVRQVDIFQGRAVALAAPVTV